LTFFPKTFLISFILNKKLATKQEKQLSKLQTLSFFLKAELKNKYNIKDKYFMIPKLISCEVGANYKFSDSLRAIHTLAEFYDEKAIDYCQNWFANYFNIETKYQFVDSGRTGMYFILNSFKKVFNWDNKSEILIQGFSCVVLPNSVWQSGLIPVLVDTEIPNTENQYNFNLQDFEQKITTKTKAMVIQYTFGIVPNMQKIVDLCRKYNLVLIEDAAHSLGAKTVIDGQEYKIGEIGNAAFFSFGRDKIVSSTIGGMFMVNPKNLIQNPDFKQKIPEIQKQIDISELPKMNQKRVFQSLIYPVLATFFIRPLYHLQIGKVILLLSRKLGLFGEIYTENEKNGTNKLETASKYSPKLANILKYQLQEMEEMNNHRRKIAKFYAEKLNLKFDEKNVYMRFPVVLENKKDYLKIKQKLRKKGVLIGTWYQSIFLPELDYHQKFNYKQGSLPNIEFLSDSRTLNLPTNIHTNLKAAEIVVSEFLDAQILR
jgi:perosamine synthetase